MHLLTCGYCYYFSHYTRLCIFILSASHWCYFWLSDHDPDTEAINDRLTMRYNSSIHNDYCSSSLFQHLGLCVQTPHLLLIYSSLSHNRWLWQPPHAECFFKSLYLGYSENLHIWVKLTFARLTITWFLGYYYHYLLTISYCVNEWIGADEHIHTMDMGNINKMKFWTIKKKIA